MKIKDTILGYGVTLRRLTEDKIEMVRRWRNDPKIRQYMEFQEEITPEMQKEWFKKIDNENNLFYIVEHNNIEIGLINIKNINNGEGEGGIFIWDDRYLNSDISFRAHLALFDYYFSFPNYNSLISHVLNNNRRAKRFTQFLGFHIFNGQENVRNQKYILGKELYLSNVNRLRYYNRYKKL